MTPIVELIRHEENFKYGTFGILKIQKQVFCVTLEPPDIENTKNVSSIPAQQYLCKKTQSPKYGLTYMVTDVPGRSYILFHSGNTVKHTKGCIILAQHFSKLRGDREVLNSGITFERFMRLMSNHDRFHLTIKEDY